MAYFGDLVGLGSYEARGLSVILAKFEVYIVGFFERREVILLQGNPCRSGLNGTETPSHP